MVLRRYLTDVGVDRVEMLQRAGCAADVEFLEILLRVVVEHQQRTVQSQTSTDFDLIIRWLEVVFSSVHCKLMFSFADPVLKSNVTEMMRSISSNAAAIDVIEQFEKLSI